jgi:hypothetical protein
MPPTMTTILRSLAWACAAAAALGPFVRAGENPPKTTGRVLVLDNERTMEGDVERVGDQYRIRRSVGETRVPAARVLHLCHSREEAYEFLRGRANLQDADERLRLANWCQVNQLRDEALAEVRAATDLRPHHAETRRLLRSLERSASGQASPPAARKDKEPEAASAAPAVELTTESLSLFVTKVQPILMNACANCHAGERDVPFKLTRTFDRGTVQRRTLQGNVAAVLAQLNVDAPELSPLLVKAVSVHGDMAQAALKGRKTPAYQSLDEWVKVTLAGNPQLRAKAAAARPVEEVVPAGGFTDKAERARVTPGSDPFDPEAFNRQAHPQRTEGKDK